MSRMTQPPQFQAMIRTTPDGYRIEVNGQFAPGTHSTPHAALLAASALAAQSARPAGRR